jgi:signal transduction histidine kinase
MRISALKYFVSSLRQYIHPSQDKALHTFEKAILTIDESIDDIRYLLINLNPKTLNEYGYLMAVEDLVNKLTRLEVIEISLRQSGMEKRFASETESALYRITQELINNTLKHADASMIELNVVATDNSITLNYSDNGKGFDSALNHEGYGIQNIKARVSLLNGSIKIESSPGAQTFVQVMIPLNHTLG